MSTRVSSGYRCEPANLDRDREDILSIWRGGLSNVAGQAAKFDWFYMQGEAGSPIVSLLLHAESGRRVGIAAAGPRRANWNGRAVRIGVLVDLAVLPEHRSLFPAMLLQRSLQQSVPGSLAALYGFPNPRAAPVFARVGYSKTLDVRRFVRVLRSRVYLRRRMPGWAAALVARPLDLAMSLWAGRRARGPDRFKAAWSSEVEARVDALWDSTAHGSGPVLVRDAGFLRWRFDRMPGKHFRYLNVEDGNGRLAAWFACEDDGGTLAVRDFWTIGGYDSIDPSIVRMLLSEAMKTGCSAVSLEFGGASNIIRILEAAGFSERSRRPFFSYFGPGSALSSDTGWYVTSADEDE